MNGISLALEENKKYLDMTLTPSEVPENLDEKSVLAYLKETEYSNYYVFDDNIAQAIQSLKKAKKNGENNPIVDRIAERIDAEVKFVLDSDEMSAKLQITSAHGGKHAGLTLLASKAKHAGIERGLSMKRIKALMLKAKEAEPGTLVEDVVAKGLPPRQGRDSKLHPLVPNALERILQPQTLSKSRVDMRDLGEIICVKAGTPILKRLAPTKGRKGFTVTGAVIEPKEGQWVKLVPGDGTRLDDSNENILIADITGMPKFQKDKMWVDDTYICKGVNVGTGNVNYDGAVLVNGDVTEKMEIIASGDITINGFVESATLRAGGDIIITQGAMGKVSDDGKEYSTQLTAQGSVHIQHGQGLNIRCNGNVTVGKQLAYSRVVCTGGVIVGPVENPNGNLFACEIQSQSSIQAGTLGAVSGSHLNVDFSDGFNSLLTRKDTMEELLLQLQRNTGRHMERMNIIKKKKLPFELEAKVKQAIELYDNEKQLLEWLQAKVTQIRLAKDLYIEEIGLKANKKLFPGVVVKLNNRVWKAEREYNSTKVGYNDHQWQSEPF